MSDLSMPVVWTDRHRLHEPKGEVWLGVWIEGTEVPARGEQDPGGPGRSARASSPRKLRRRPLLEAVHDPALLSFLDTAYDEWVAGGYLEEPGQDRVVPYVFPLPQLTPGRAPHRPASASARTGMFAMDTMTLIGPDMGGGHGPPPKPRSPPPTWCRRRHRRLCRVPATRAPRRARLLRGSCYLNNAAIAAQRCGSAVSQGRRDHRPRRPPRQRHPGDLLPMPRRCLRVGARRPRRRLVPPLRGYADETGEGDGAGANHNLPLRPGDGDAGWLEAVGRLAGFAADRGVGGLVVSLGRGRRPGRPGEPVQVTVEGYAGAGRIIAGLGLPTVFVQEGGYHLDSLGHWCWLRCSRSRGRGGRA